MEIGNLQAEKSQLAAFTVGRLLRKKSQRFKVPGNNIR